MGGWEYAQYQHAWQAMLYRHPVTTAHRSGLDMANAHDPFCTTRRRDPGRTTMARLGARCGARRAGWHDEWLIDDASQSIHSEGNRRATSARCNFANIAIRNMDRIPRNMFCVSKHDGRPFLPMHPNSPSSSYARTTFNVGRHVAPIPPLRLPLDRAPPRHRPHEPLLVVTAAAAPKTQPLPPKSSPRGSNVWAMRPRQSIRPAVRRGAFGGQRTSHSLLAPPRLLDRASCERGREGFALGPKRQG